MAASAGNGTLQMHRGCTCSQAGTRRQCRLSGRRAPVGRSCSLAWPLLPPEVSQTGATGRRVQHGCKNAQRATARPQAASRKPQAASPRAAPFACCLLCRRTAAAVLLLPPPPPPLLLLLLLLAACCLLLLLLARLGVAFGVAAGVAFKVAASHSRNRCPIVFACLRCCSPHSSLSVCLPSCTCSLCVQRPARSGQPSPSIGSFGRLGRCPRAPAFSVLWRCPQIAPPCVHACPSLAPRAPE